MVEVSFSPREMDLKKLALYAQGGVPEVWLVEEGGSLEVYREPRGTRYRHRLLVEPGEEVAPSSSPIPLSSGTPLEVPRPRELLPDGPRTLS